MKRVVNRLLYRLGLEIRHRGKESLRELMTTQLTENDQRIVDRAQPYSKTGPERLLSLVDSIRYVVANGIPGDIVECGVWRGGSMVAAALALMDANDTSRRLYLYDTYEGMTEPTTADTDIRGIPARDLLGKTPKGTGAWCAADLEDVKANMYSTGYPEENISFVIGRVEETIPSVVPESIALLRLDTDWYESTRHELAFLYPRLSPRGVLILDDYGHWRGARKAADEYFESLGVRPLLQRIDYTGRLVLKLDCE